MQLPSSVRARSLVIRMDAEFVSDSAQLEDAVSSVTLKQSAEVSSVSVPQSSASQLLAGGSGDDSGGFDGKGRGGGGGDGGSGGEGNDQPPQPPRRIATPSAEQEHLIAVKSLKDILADRGIGLMTLPHEISAAIKHGAITPALLSRYLDLNKDTITSLMMRLGAGMRSRILADPKFLFKIAVEESIGVAGKISAEYNKRQERFWLELDFVCANLIMALIADFALVWIPAPVTHFSIGSASPSKLKMFLNSLPSSIFQKAPIGRRNYPIHHRLAAYFIKASQLFCVGFGSSATGTSITALLIWCRKMLDPENESSSKPSPILKTSLLYGTFMSSSSNTRYQLLNGIEQWIIDPALHNYPALSKVATFILRFGNTFWGSSQWVDFTRLMGVSPPRTKE
eukprot:CAMPEP_0184671258 /NCGR_PEP_ID=MMETSP0308-20130426/85386_1 /TAXON_ID=38269 /ORGANISM="Gloeochaete witrockiana, Strain SAG 46.84" /LENGTH=396 /DNA_ID=CAMNT_0027118341 /DNA_START=286 /DNA_END=1476 /DNA_ORIENTATION=-